MCRRGAGGGRGWTVDYIIVHSCKAVVWTEMKDYDSHVRDVSVFFQHLRRSLLHPLIMSSYVKVCKIIAVASTSSSKCCSVWALGWDDLMTDRSLLEIQKIQITFSIKIKPRGVEPRRGHEGKGKAHVWVGGVTPFSQHPVHPAIISRYTQTDPRWHYPSIVQCECILCCVQCRHSPVNRRNIRYRSAASTLVTDSEVSKRWAEFYTTTNCTVPS